MFYNNFTFRQDRVILFNTEIPTSVTFKYVKISVIMYYIKWKLAYFVQIVHLYFIFENISVVVSIVASQINKINKTLNLLNV